jgi:hypothetical protein
METLTESCEKRPYPAPAFRIIDICAERSFLQSNTEPIGGGNDPDIDW